MIKEAAQFSYQISLFKNVAWEILHFRFFFIPAFCSFFAEYFYTSLYVFFFYYMFWLLPRLWELSTKKQHRNLQWTQKKKQVEYRGYYFSTHNNQIPGKKEEFDKKKEGKILCKMFSKIFRKSPRSPSHLKTINKITFSFFFIVRCNLLCKDTIFNDPLFAPYFSFIFFQFIFIAPYQKP